MVSATIAFSRCRGSLGSILCQLHKHSWRGFSGEFSASI
jgi:hypothetical protein